MVQTTLNVKILEDTSLVIYACGLLNFYQPQKMKVGLRASGGSVQFKKKK